MRYYAVLERGSGRRELYRRSRLFCYRRNGLKMNLGLFTKNIDLKGVFYIWKHKVAAVNLKHKLSEMETYGLSDNACDLTYKIVTSKIIIFHSFKMFC